MLKSFVWIPLTIYRYKKGNRGLALLIQTLMRVTYEKATCCHVLAEVDGNSKSISVLYLNVYQIF